MRAPEVGILPRLLEQQGGIKDNSEVERLVNRVNDDFICYKKRSQENSLKVSIITITL